MKYDYMQFKEWLNTVPVIESHEHYDGQTAPYDNIFELVINNYLLTDMMVANGGADPLEVIAQCDTFEQKCEVFLSMYTNAQFTCYGQAARSAFLMCWDADILTTEGLTKIRDEQAKRTQEFGDKLIEKAGIKAAVCDLFDVGMLLYDKTKVYADWCRFAISTPDWHRIMSFKDVADVNGKDFRSGEIACLDDYIGAMGACVDKCMEDGRFVAMKDQSAYSRDIGYKNPTKEDAELVFYKMVDDHEKILSSHDARVLSDYLFHAIVTLSEKHEIPMQIHTGHMAGGDNDVSKANAAKLTDLISLHPNAVFDLFHGNYPYMGDFLFLGKNYPHVVLDLCWVHSIDTDYSIELMRRMVLTCPTNKVLAFGGDTFGVEAQVSYLEQARENIAKAMCSLIDDGVLEEMQAKRIAADWLYNNPNRIYKLGLPRYDVS